MLQHPIKLSTLLQDYVTGLCSCGDLNVSISVTSCTDSRAVYSIQLTGIMATEGALWLITKVENLTDGLNLTMVVLHLQEQLSSLESNCTDADDDQVHSHIVGVVTALSVMIILLVILLLVLVFFLNSVICPRYGKTIASYFTVILTYASFILYRKRPEVTKMPMTRNNNMAKTVNAPYYHSIATPCHYAISSYSQLQQCNMATIIPIRRSNSDSSLTCNEQVAVSTISEYQKKQHYNAAYHPK